MFAKAWLAVAARDGTQMLEFAILESASLFSGIPSAQDTLALDRILEVQKPMTWLSPLA